MPLATDFLNAFVAAYNQARGLHDDAQWQEIWGDFGGFSNFMLYNNDSVIRRVPAHMPAHMNLRLHPGEPMHFDAVFTDVANIWSWFPPVVVVEHENNPNGFHGEIQKLLSLRAKLKVGITYFMIGDRGTADELGNNLVGSIAALHNQAQQNIPEDPGAEYLFILGVENPVRTLEWRALQFHAGAANIAMRTFEPA
jgi:hypothetical protein